ncbi:MAG TPA: response regulator [Polyangiaceae bacterium]|nr:response regulator [Polyangiaceae bacterium]
MSSSDAGAPPPRPARVLLVDPDPPSVRLVLAVLSTEDFRVLVAATALDALRIAPAFQPELVVLELILPDMNGLDLARILKSDPSTRSAAIVVLTASNGSEGLAREIGCADYIRKPVDVLSLPARFRSHLGKKVESNGTAKGSQ